MNKAFEKLVQDFCRLCGITEVDRVAAGAAVEVDGVNFSMLYDEESAPDRIGVYCDYGAVPTGREAEVYRALLETNLVLYSSDSAVFSVSPETGRVICSVRFMLESLCAEELRGTMTFLSQKAKEWREHYFDVSKPEKTAASRQSALGQRVAAEFKAGKR